MSLNPYDQKQSSPTPRQPRWTGQRGSPHARAAQGAGDQGRARATSARGAEAETITNQTDTMNTKLITALRTTAAAIENNTFDYKWERRERCNCGSLFCSLTGRSAAGLSKIIPNSVNGSTRANWTELVGQYCPISGVSEHELFRELMGYGLTPRDMIELDGLYNKEVRSRMKLKTIQPKRRWYQFRAPVPYVEDIDYENERHVVAYMRAWADLLTERGQLDAPQGNGLAYADAAPQQSE